MLDHLTPAKPRKLVAFAAALCFASAAGASDDLPETVWWCHYDGKVSIFCELVDGPPADPVTDEDILSAPAPYPSRGPLPPIVRLIAENPGALLGITVRIPLISPPLDMGRVQQLADAVMCANNPNCRVEF